MSRSRRNRHKLIEEEKKNPILFFDELINIGDAAKWAAMLRIHMEYKRKEENGN